MEKENETDRMLDELVKGKSPEELLGKSGVLKQLTKRLVERALEGEMTTHLGYEKNARKERARATLATEKRRSRSKLISVKLRSKYRGIETGSSNLNS